jgi:WD40 repeat protein
VTFDPTTQEDVVKDRALSHFIRHLSWGLPRFQPTPAIAATTSSLEDASMQRTMAAFILSVICSGYSLGQSECISEKLHVTICSLLQPLESADDSEREEAETNMSYQNLMWLIICLGNLSKDNAAAQSELYKVGSHFRLFVRIQDDSPCVRSASCYALGNLIGSAPPSSVVSEAVTTLPSLFQQQSQPQLQRLPQSLVPTFQHDRTLIDAMGTSAVKANTSSQSSASTPAFMPTLNPPQLVSSHPGVPIHAQGSFNLVRRGQQPMVFGSILSTPAPPSRASPQPEMRTVYKDEQRMDLDLSVASVLAKATVDASPEVRFEAVLAVNRFIAKYIDAFVSIAGKSFDGQVPGRSIIGESIILPFPVVGSDVEDKMTAIWAAVHKSDSFPSVRELLNSIVISVKKRAVSEINKIRFQQSTLRRRSITGSIDEVGRYGSANFHPPSSYGDRSTSGFYLPSYSSPGKAMKQDGSAGTSISTPQAANASPTGLNRMSSTPDVRNISERNLQTIPTPIEEYFCPESKFYCWQKVAFDNPADNASFDPLSDNGAMKRYRKTRNNHVKQASKVLKETYSILAQPYDESDAAAGLEMEADSKKEALQLKQVSLLRNSGGRSTSLLLFHPYEPVLVVCGGSDNISVWNLETSKREVSFSNSNNPKSTRMSSALWINEASTSLLLIGSNDGTVRIHDGLFEPNDEISREKPSLISSFVAAPDIASDMRYSSGLVLDFQQGGGQLIAGGNTNVIRCWDVSAEKCRNSFDRKCNAPLTTITTACDHDYTNGYSGIGPDVIVAGYGNGSLRVFDTRSSSGDPAQVLNGGSASRRKKFTEFDEHGSWIVDVSFNTYGGRHEVSYVQVFNILTPEGSYSIYSYSYIRSQIVSGCVAGSIKFWDLRLASSIRTIDHRMQMTALSAHATVPMFATGSPTQFIKIMSHDGMTQQVIRYHEKISGQRIGPVSCLSFHPHAQLLAAGFADDIVSVYAPKKNLRP